MSASTKPIYQYDERLRYHVARIVSVCSYEELAEVERVLYKPDAGDVGLVHAIETNETIFFAQGGGQPFDTGFMDIAGKCRFDVKAVRSVSEHRILHFGTYGGQTSSHFAVGDVLNQHIDGDRRDKNSRAHTAGHLVALAVLRIAERNQTLKIEDGKGSHFPDACWVEFKGLIDGKLKTAIEQQSNTFVDEKLPVQLYWCRPEELPNKDVLLAPGMPVMTGADGLVRIVDIVGAGAYPCGGTHVQDTSLVGRITIRGIKRQKGISKISYAVSYESKD